MDINKVNKNLYLRYRCKNGYMFENGDFPYWYNDCQPNREWIRKNSALGCMSKNLGFKSITFQPQDADPFENAIKFKNQNKKIYQHLEFQN